MREKGDSKEDIFLEGSQARAAQSQTGGWHHEGFAELPITDSL